MRIKHYKSGSNRTPDILAFTALNLPFGVVATELRREQRELLTREIPIELFIDSGAFGEVDDDLNVIHPISDDEWDYIFDIYEEMTRAHAHRVTVVAPDRIGDQTETLVRMATYAERVYELTCLGARVLVPIQKGEVCLSEFYEQARYFLGFEDDARYVPAIPMKKGATSVLELEGFVRDVRPRELHLLGIGPMNRNIGKILKACQYVPELTMDSNVLTAKVGRQGSKPRPLTHAADKASVLIEAHLGPKRMIYRGQEFMLDGASSEWGDRYATSANADYAFHEQAIWPRRDPACMRQIKKLSAILDVFG